MQSQVFKWTSFLTTTAIAVALWNGAKPSADGGWHTGFMGVAVLTSLGALVLLAWAIVGSARTDESSAAVLGHVPARIHAKKSSKWTIKDSIFSGDRPAIDADRSPGWQIENTIFDEGESDEP